MAQFAFAMPNPLAKMNPHVLAGTTIFTITVIVLAAIALFGRVDSAMPVAKIEIPSLADMAKTQASLRADDGHQPQKPLPVIHRQSEPSLPGITVPKATPHDTTTTTEHHATPTLPVSADALPQAPIAGLSEPGPGGRLPMISEAGQRPASAYARPFAAKPGKPVVSLVVGGLGMMKNTTMAAIEELPAEVTLSFVPYTPDLQSWVDRARAAGHEVMIELPMEPFGYPDTDPGPYTLLSTASSAENTRRLEWLLSRTTGYFGVTNYMGSKLTASENALAPVFRGLNRRGVDFLYDGETRRSSLTNVAKAEGLSWTIADRIVDIKQTTAAIDDQLLRLEALAIQNGSAIGKGFSWPVTIKQLRDWTGSLEAKGYQLAPVSAVILMREEKAGASTTTAAKTETASKKEHH
ncbi:Possible divergent polysaccharide deacetylase [hydrothermal vent metagenome]|uniref:Possible divergent polysaccharide deacetylase n=1 Tax=hydrothermal vent metagenome TaxID=652676 RepID=A0A3B0RQ67_9ZZZZ